MEVINTMFKTRLLKSFEKSTWGIFNSGKLKEIILEEPDETDQFTWDKE